MAAKNRPAATGGEKARASRLRRTLARGEYVKEVDRLWLADHEENHPPRGGAPKVIDVEPVGRPVGNTSEKDHGRSRSGRKVKFEMEEAAESEGTGAAAPTAASAAVQALTSREEGRRIDALTINALSIMESACKQYSDMVANLSTLVSTYQTHHLEYLDALREHHLARTQAEADTVAVVRQAEQAAAGDPAKDLMIMALMKHFGIDLPPGAVGAAAAAAAGNTRPPPNGNAKTKA